MLRDSRELSTDADESGPSAAVLDVAAVPSRFRFFAARRLCSSMSFSTALSTTVDESVFVAFFILRM